MGERRGGGKRRVRTRGEKKSPSERRGVVRERGRVGARRLAVAVRAAGRALVDGPEHDAADPSVDVYMPPAATPCGSYLSDFRVVGVTSAYMRRGLGRSLRDFVGPAVRLVGLGLARGRLGHVAMAVGACARYD